MQLSPVKRGGADPVVKESRFERGTGTFTVSYGITESNELRTATLKGPFFPGVEATYLLTMTDYGAPATITRP